MTTIRERVRGFYATPVDLRVHKAMRDVAHGTMNYNRGMRNRIVGNARKVNATIDGWFPEPEPDATVTVEEARRTRSMPKRIAAGALKVLAAPFYVLYSALETAASVVVTAAAVVIEAALATVRAVGWVLLSAAYAARVVAGVALWIVAVALAAVTLLVMALVGVLSIGVSFVAFLLDQAARAVSPVALPSVRAYVESHWGAEDAPPVQEPSADERGFLRTVRTAGGVA